MVSVAGICDDLVYTVTTIHLDQVGLRLSIDSVSRSPLYSIYGETIAGVTILRAFGAGSKFLRDMLACVDTVRYSFNLTMVLDLTVNLEFNSILLDRGSYKKVTKFVTLARFSALQQS